MLSPKFNPFTGKLDFVQNLSGYPPYTGATADLDLGAFRLWGEGISIGDLHYDNVATTSLSPVNSVFDRVYTRFSLLYTNRTIEAGTTKGTPFTVLPLSTHYLFLGKADPFGAITIDFAQFATLGELGLVLQFYYSSVDDGGSAIWKDFTADVVDGTNAFTQNGQITFSPPADWVTTKPTTTSDYYYYVYIRSSTSSINDATVYSITPATQYGTAIYGNGLDQANSITPSFYTDEWGRPKATNLQVSSLYSDGNIEAANYMYSAYTLIGTLGIGEDKWNNSYLYQSGAYSEQYGLNENVVYDLWNNQTGDYCFGLRYADDMGMIGSDYQLALETGLNFTMARDFGLGMLPVTGTKLSLLGNLGIIGNIENPVGNNNDLVFQNYYPSSSVGYSFNAHNGIDGMMEILNLSAAGGADFGNRPITTTGTVTGGILSATSEAITPLLTAQKAVIQSDTVNAFDYFGTYYLAALYDYTAEAKSSWGTAFIIGQHVTAGEYTWIGHADQFTNIYFRLAAVGTNVAYTWEYSTGETTWSPLTVTDGTTNFTVATANVSFTPPVDWAAGTVNGYTGFLVRYKPTTTSPTTHPTAHMVVPTAPTDKAVELYANEGDTIPVCSIMPHGNIHFGIIAAESIAYRYYFGNTVGISGGLYMSGLLSGVSTIASSGTHTNTYASVLFSRSIYGQTFSGSAATAILPKQNSQGIIMQSQAWNGTATAVNSISEYIDSIPEAATSSCRKVWRNSQLNGVAVDEDIMSLSSDGSLNVIGRTLGSEVLATADFATNANWTVGGDWAYTTGDYTFTYATGAGTLTQAAAAMLIPLKPNAWYKFLPGVGVVGPSGTVAYIGTECAEKRVYFQVSSTTEVPVYFKTNSAPGSFVIYTTATTTSGLRLDDVSLKEVTGGCVNVTGCLRSDGGITSKVTNVVDTYQVLVTDYTVVGNKGTAFTITLPIAVVGQIFNIKNIGAGVITVDGYSTDTIDGATTQTLNQWNGIQIQCYAANSWAIISHV